MSRDLSHFIQAGPARRPEDPTFALLDVVCLRRPRPDLGLEPGDCGTVVDVFDSPRRAYEIEFVAPDGHTRALAVLEASELSPTEPDPDRRTSS